MFAPKGWISLNEIFLSISAIFDEEGRIGDIEFFGDENFEVTWLYMQESSEVAVCLANGEALPASRFLTFTFDPYDNLNDHIDIMVGTVGSALSPNHLNEPPDERELQRRYGPFLHLPLIFPHDDFIDFLNELEADVPAFLTPRTQNTADVDQRSQGANDSPPEKAKSPKALSDEIVRLVDLGALPKFQDAKSLLGDEVSVRGFRFAWNLARERRPDISKPGRKPKKPKS
ncbi:hypothetical protein K3727_19190 [Rhodobacteraceae bacterium M382]|nr:hypothetical protein K3727_19190 [Rhodobacteraceae bacterium M382]